ncbi:16S rRNA (guanine(966)-N(2))-methyltransferase [Martelella alba]|uniref:16S rRNA (Guanine(966)-N(2))-methyltransferase n=1 Tax=Martelella alba TaxID=2590451 RepID=A0ABY2SP39_9HYPH|nr:16S rRNA (guanine(966)-N(2))-methyltransferase [Martelella alba]TKI07161.1 16S rRNA (guanine(966)-N(2))-methyltransferase [Martelella alba]
MAKNTLTRPAGHIRLISGRWRGRKLPVPDSPGLRPTTDRVRETLFNWLAPVIRDARCLDCFAGSGALGFEALSRYAGSATLLERDRAVAAQLDKNLRLLEAANGEVIAADCLRWLDRPGTPYDVIFLDPPFRQNLLDPAARLLEQHGWLAPQAWIYIETETENRSLSLPPTWRPHREKTAGQVAYRLFFRQDTSQEL